MDLQSFRTFDEMRNNRQPNGNIYSHVSADTYLTNSKHDKNFAEFVRNKKITANNVHKRSVTFIL